MTDTPDAPAPAEDSGSFFGNLFNLYFEPAAAFARIFVKSRVALAILLQVLVGVAFTSVWLAKVDTREFMRAQMELNPRIQSMPAEQVERIIDTQSRFMKGWGRIAPFIAPLVGDLVVAGVLMFVFRFFIAADVSFLKSLSVVVWSFVAMGLVQTPISLAILTLKGDWNVDPSNIIQSNPTIFFEQSAIPRWLWSLLSSLDLFTFWTLFILGTGYAVASKKGLTTGLLGVGVPWAMIVMLKVGFRLVVG